MKLRRLRTLDQVHARRHATPKAQLETRLDRAVAKQLQRRDDSRRLQTWAMHVKNRDRWMDRKTGVKVLRTIALDPLRAEAHHIEPKGNQDTRYDSRNGLCLSFATHTAVEAGVYRIEGTKFFRKNGARYIDGRAPVIFVRT